MVFSSLTFLFIFLPVVFALYCAIPNLKVRNGILILFSLLFYAYGEPIYVLLMIASTIINYCVGIGIGRAQVRGGSGRAMLGVGVAANLGLLAFFKYSGMIVGTLDGVLGMHIPVPAVELPIGISFFTFQAMSYVIDVYRRDVNAERNYADVLLYISFFPQLIAGPIVKYHDINEAIHARTFDIVEIARGLRRFCVGLAKKVLLANQFALVCDAIYAAPSSDLNILTAWLGALAYMLQIYFDFSGYSDMAIGLGHMFGFTFKENFNYPYKSKSIKEFWRRWHISLSTWFLEYLYIPLGGNRRGRGRACLNKCIVFFLCGLWHGASWTFVAWGLYHGLFLLLEEYVPVLRKLPAPIAHIYAMVVVLFGWVLFRAESFGQAVDMASLMVSGFTFTHTQIAFFLEQLAPTFLVAFACGCVAALPVRALAVRVLDARSGSWWVQGLSYVCAAGLLVMCVLQLSAGSYNPFIYFRF